MKILVLGLGDVPPRFHFASTHCENYIERYMEGHEIITFGYNKGVDIQMMPEDDFTMVTEKLPHDWAPDCCILWEVDWNLLPRGIENAPFPTVAIPFDWDYDIPLSRACVELTDFTIASGTTEQNALLALTAEGKIEKCYPGGIMQKYFAKNPKKIKDRNIDIFYTMGESHLEHLDRVEWVIRLTHLSDTYRIKIGAHQSNYDDYIEALRDSKLVFSHQRFGSMSGRILDAGAQGTVTIETGVEAKNHFIPNEDFVPVSEENFNEQIKKYLTSEPLLQKVSDNIYSKVTREFESRRRFITLLDYLQDLFKNRKLRKKTTVTDSAKRHIQRGEIYYYSFFRTNNYFIAKSGSKLLDLSIDEFKKAVSIDPTPNAMTSLAVAIMAYGFSIYRKENLQDVIQSVTTILEQVIASHPQYTMAYFNLGLLNMRITNYGKALDFFTVALKLLNDTECRNDPWCLHNRDLEVFNQLVRKHLNENLLLLCSGEKDTALEKIRNLYKAVILYLIATIEEEHGRVDKVLDALQESQNLFPASGVITVNAAKKLFQLGYYEESIKMYEKAIGVLPMHIDDRMEYLMLLYACRMDSKANTDIEKVINITNSVEMLKSKTKILVKLKDDCAKLYNSYNYCKEKLLNSSVKLLYGYLRKNPNSVTIITRIAEIWAELGRLDKALEILENYISDDTGMLKNDKVRSQMKDIYEKYQLASEQQNKELLVKLNSFKKSLSIAQMEHSMGRHTSIHSLPNKELVSIIIPTYNRPDFLKKALESIVTQTYKNIEAIVINDAGKDVSDIIDTFQGRLTVKYLSNTLNQDRAAARNTAIKHASGQYIAYLDDDDVFYPDHIETALKVLTTTDYKVVYTDACRACQIKDGNSYKTIKKDVPYSIDYTKGIFYKTNITPILCVVHDRACLEGVGMFDESLSVLEDWDLWIRMAEKYDFYHIKKVTCEFSWREDGTSTTSNKAGEFARVRRLIYERYSKQIQALTAQQKIVSIIMLTWNALDYTKKCVNSIQHHTSYPHEIIFVDNASTDGTVEYLRNLVKEHSNYKLIENQENRGFAAGNNQGVAAASGEYVLLLNNDVLVSVGWLESLVESLEKDEKIGMVGPITNSISGRQMVSSIPYTDDAGFHEFSQKIRKACYGRLTPRYRIAGFAVLLKKSLYEEVGGLDESFGTGNYEDDDLCLKIREKGYVIMVDESVFIHHYRSQTFIENKIDYKMSIATNDSRFRQKWPRVDYEELLELHVSLTDTNAALVSQGRQVLESGNTHKAIELFSKVVNTNPIDNAALCGLGLACQANGEIDNAINAYKKVIEIHSCSHQMLKPGNGSYLFDAYHNLAILYANTNQIDNAISLLEKVVTLQSHDAPLYNNLGVLYYRKGMCDDARTCFEKALALDPGYEEARQNFAKVSRQKNS